MIYMIYVNVVSYMDSFEHVKPASHFFDNSYLVMM